MLEFSKMHIEKESAAQDKEVDPGLFPSQVEQTSDVSLETRAGSWFENVS